MVLLSRSLHCLSHRRPYYMPYLAWRIPFLSALNFNATTLRWPPYSSSCFDIILHFPCVCVCVLVYYFPENQKRRSVCTTVRSHFADCSVKLWCSAAKRRGEKGGEQENRARGERWEKRKAEQNWGVLPLKPPLQIGGVERGSKWLVLCGWRDTLKSPSHLQHSLHQVH